MSIKSFIGLENERGEIRGIYCHWNGSPSYTGRILLENYTDKEKINSLLDLGDISSLGPEIGQKQDWNDFNYRWTIAYHRDYDEIYNYENYGSLSTALNRLSYIGYDYMFIFSQNKWIFSSPNLLEWKDLNTFLIQNE